MHVELREVGPRDGLQSGPTVAPAARADLAVRLAGCGLRHVEVAAFVSPAAVPAMAGAAEVVRALPAKPGVTWWALVPNCRGAAAAAEAGITALTVTVSASPGYSERNVGRTVAEALSELGRIRALVADHVIDVVISCAFGSPFGDVERCSDVRAVVDACRGLGADRLTLADTTGTATPRRVAAVLAQVGTDVGLHLHDNRGTALANALAAIELGVRRFDTAIGGTGGSPFAPGAGGNLATEDLLLVLDDHAVSTGVDIAPLLDLMPVLEAMLGRAAPSRTSAAGTLPSFEPAVAP